MKKDSPHSSKRKTFWKKWLFLLLFSLWVSLLHGVDAKSEPTPPSSECDGAEKLVENFLKLDAAIGRLSSEDYKKHFDSMIVYKIDGQIVHEEPGWDVLTVIRGSQITGCQVQTNGFQSYKTYQVKVSYDSLGDLSHGLAGGQCPLFVPKKVQAEEDDFEVLKIKNVFKIRLAPGPHVSVTRGINWIEKGSLGCTKEKAESIRQIEGLPPQ